MSKVRKIIKVLAKKASGLGRKAKLAEMKKGLMALDLVRMQDCREGAFPRISREDIDAVGVLLDRASVRR
tara:strand:+ start:151 stop:360 length:210 start_codon:yes stop_codon:yes gene_type:complete